MKTKICEIFYFLMEMILSRVRHSKHQHQAHSTKFSSLKKNINTTYIENNSIVIETQKIKTS